MRHLVSVALALLLSGAGASFVGTSALLAGLGVRQAVRAAPIHPLGAAAGLLALLLGLVCWLIARRRLHALDAEHFRAWRLREL